MRITRLLVAPVLLACAEIFAIKSLSLLLEPNSFGWPLLWNPLQDSKRFDGIDTDFKELANAMHKTPNVVEATNQPGLFEKLEDIQSRYGFSRNELLLFSSSFCMSWSSLLFILSPLSQTLTHGYTNKQWPCDHCVFFYRLSLCEKALAEYLDTKRLAFPRFYFISSADLLDILSNGTNPHQVAHLIFVNK